MNLTTETAHFTPMGRVVDVARIGGMHAGPGSLTVRVSDPLCPWNEGDWRLETVDGRLQVHSVQENDTAHGAGCTLSIQGLSALVYGAHDPADLSLRGWGDPSPEVLTVLRTMFPHRLPYLHEIF